MFWRKKSKQAAELRQALDDIHSVAFPGGDAEVRRDAQIVKSITSGKISDGDLSYFTIKCKTLIYIASDKYDSQRFVESYLHSAEGKITKDEAWEIYATFLREYLEKVM